MLNPKFDPKMVQKVNRAIDTPQLIDAYLNNRSKKYLVPGLNMTGHRRFNHDLLSALLKGYQVGGYAGAQAAYYHLLADTFSNNMSRSLRSSDLRDSFLSMIMAQRKVPHFNLNPK